MPPSTATQFKRLLGATPAVRRRLAADLVARETEFAAWLSLFNAAYVTRPEREALAARALAEAASRRRESLAAARFRLLEARAIQRASSPVEAVRAFARAARELRQAGDPERAAQADVLAVDALAHAGKPREALRLAAGAGRRLRGPRAPLWRAALRINRANGLRLVGDVSRAVTEYAHAARDLDRLGDPHTAAIARANAGVALLDIGEAEEAERHLEPAARAFESAGQTDLALEARYNLACAAVRAGRLGEGLRALESLAGEHARRGLHRREALCRMDLADALLRAGDRISAEREAVRAVLLFRRDRAHAESVEALWLAARAAPDVRRSAAHLRQARRAAEKTSRPALGLRCDLLELDRGLAAGRLPDGKRLATIRARARSLGQTGIEAEARLLGAHGALLRGRLGDARRGFADPSLRRPGRPWVRVAAETGLALVDARAGRLGVALGRLRRISAFLDAVRLGLPGAWLRTAFLLERLDPYLARVDLLLGRGRPADWREAEALLDALAARRFLESAPTGTAGRRLGALRRRLESIYDRLGRGAGPLRGVEGAEAVRLEREARRLERQAADAWRAAERREAPRPGAETAAPGSVPLAAGSTVVHVWARRGHVLGLVRTADRVTCHADLGPAAALARCLGTLAFHDERVRHGLTPDAVFPLETALDDLARRLLLPLGAGAWAAQVALVLDPSLPDVPWELLPLEGGPLASVRRLVRRPALRVSLPEVPAGRGRAWIALGEPDLPALSREAAGLSAEAERIEGPRATRDAIRHALCERGVVHIAGHGFEAPEAPALGGVRVADGWFGAEDVPDRIAARLVVLAACRTGRPPGPAGDAWGGLPQALLRAGARHVLYTAADVDDELTADLMSAFHAVLGDAAPALAFGRALAEVAKARRHPGGLLAFRLTGMEP